MLLKYLWELGYFVFVSVSNIFVHPNFYYIHYVK